MLSTNGWHAASRERTILAEEMKSHNDEMASENQDPRVYLAVERTFLAWIRTGIALMGFGFVVARFGIFLHEVSAVSVTVAPRSHGFSVWAGTGIMMTGVMILALTVIQHYRTIRRLNEDISITGKPSVVGMVLAGLLALIGLVIIGYLVILSLG